MKRFTAVFLVLVLALSLAACTQADDTTAPTENGKTLAPDFTVYDVEGNPVKLSDFRGKPVVLNFWASWCPPCKSEMPDFQKEFEDQGQDVQFLIVNLTDGSRETVETALAYIAQQGYTFPVYFDTAYAAVNAYNVRSIPATYFIDAQGYVVAQFTGALNREQLQQGDCPDPGDRLTKRAGQRICPFFNVINWRFSEICFSFSIGPQDAVDCQNLGQKFDVFLPCSLPKAVL